jgi:hypothetical protein
MKCIFMVALMAAAVLLLVPSCATVSKEPLTPGEVRLLGINIREMGDIRANLQYPMDIRFETDGRPEMIRACFSWSGDGPYCFKVRDVNYGSGTIRVDFRAPANKGRYILESYVIYTGEEKTRSTNVLRTPVSVISK